MTLHRPKIAVVGCGAVSELCHLPAARQVSSIEIVGLVDSRLERAELLARKFGVTETFTDYRSLPSAVEGAVVAVPNCLHAQTTVDLLHRGIGVLVEKPMATSVDQAIRMVDAACTTGVLLQVGQKFRFCEGSRLIKRAVEDDWLGELQNFSIELGGVFRWPTVTGSFFRREQAGGGVLIDNGSHVIDLLLWWLGGEPVELLYRDDSLGGVEADCELKVAIEREGQVIHGNVLLSRLRNLRNTARITGDRFTVECDLTAPAKVWMWPTGGDKKTMGFSHEAAGAAAQSWDDVHAAQLTAFAVALRDGGSSAVPAGSVLPTVALIERCYSERQPLERPWDPTPTPGTRKRHHGIGRALITGITGFVGCRLAEIGMREGIPVVGLVRTWSGAARVSRLPVPLVEGDLLDRDSLRKAMNGCDIVFHCAVDKSVWGKEHRRRMVEGMRNLLEAALSVGVKRVIHLSSTAVYSFRPRPDAATEAGRCQYSGDDYCDGKIDCEELALAYHANHELQVTILRPSIVYGPFSHYATSIAKSARQGRLVLVEGGKTVCNTVYVDNLIEAMLIAAEHENSVGQVFYVGDSSTVTCREFIESHVRALGDGYLPLPDITEWELRVIERRLRPSTLGKTIEFLADPHVRKLLRRIPAVDRLVRLMKATRKGLSAEPRSSRTNGGVDPLRSSGRPILPVDPDTSVYAANSTGVRFSADRARQVLGYEPQIDFREAMRRTVAWMEWARL